MAKDLLGWQEEAAGEKFGGNFIFTDRLGKKIRCVNNLTNRPFDMWTAQGWMLEVLRRCWRLNGETIIIDIYGNVHDGQHRLIGLVLAAQELLLDAKRTAVERAELSVPTNGWADEFWSEEPWMDALIVFGIDADDETVNTIGTGRPRTFADALYRSKWFASLSQDIRESCSKIASGALKLLWFRSANDEQSFVPGYRPHSESFQFLNDHPKVVDCVKFIRDENQGKQPPMGLTQFIQIGQATALMYLMGCSATDPSDAKNPKRYDVTLNESSLDWSLWDKAQSFWVDLAGNGKATEGLREALLDYKPEIFGVGSFERDYKCSLIINAWHHFSDNKKIIHQIEKGEEGEGSKVIKSNIEVEVSYVEGQPVIAQKPRLGGIDVGKAKI